MFLEFIYSYPNIDIQIFSSFVPFIDFWICKLAKSNKLLTLKFHIPLLLEYQFFTILLKPQELPFAMTHAAIPSHLFIFRFWDYVQLLPKKDASFGGKKSINLSVHSSFCKMTLTLSIINYFSKQVL